MLSKEKGESRNDEKIGRCHFCENEYRRKDAYQMW